jgi:membrane protein implicated in regulation of membrane protease activity
MAWVWLILGVALAVAEVFSAAFVLVMFSAGALAAAAVAAAGLPIGLQVLAFGLVSAGTLALLRPMITRRLGAGGDDFAEMGLDAIEGSSALVLERIDLDHGMIKIGGELWTARPYDSTEVFEEGQRVRVIEIKGVTALVWKE